MIKFVKVKDVLKNYTDVYCEEQELKSMDATIGNVLELDKILGNKNIRYLEEADIWRYKRKRLKTVSNNTVRREFSILKTALREGIKEEIIIGRVIIKKNWKS